MSAILAPFLITSISSADLIILVFINSLETSVNTENVKIEDNLSLTSNVT